MTITLRPYQTDLVDRTYNSWSNGAQNVLMQAATGAGKTRMLAYILQHHDGAACVIAHRDMLLSQLSAALAECGVYHDLICNDATRREIVALHVLRFGRCFIRPGARIRVASVNTIIRRDVAQWAAQVTLWVTDEGHHLLTGVSENQWGKAVKAFTHPNVRGLLPTATPSRADGKGLGRHADGLADVMVQGPPTRWLIEQGYLTDYRVICPQSDMTVLADVAASGDWSPKVLKEASQRSHIVGDVVASYLAHAPGRLGATFATDVETATNMAQAYRDAGVPAEVLTGDTDARTRVGILKRLERREILQLVTVDIVSEGFDLPALEVLSMARPTQSLSLYLQQFGRGLRPVYAGGGEPPTAADRIAAQAASAKGRYALLIDHVGNFLRHQGGPDAPRVWTLDRRDKRRSAPSDAIGLRVCLSCLQPFERIRTACPHCGEPIPAPSTRSSPAAVDGDLYELDRDVLDALRAQIPGDVATAQIAWTGLPDVAYRANIRRHEERLDALGELRAAMGRWGGVWHARGESDREIQRRWYATFGLDVLSAQALGRADAVALTDRVRAACDGR